MDPLPRCLRTSDAPPWAQAGTSIKPNVGAAGAPWHVQGRGAVRSPSCTSRMSATDVVGWSAAGRAARRVTAQGRGEHLVRAAAPGCVDRGPVGPVRVMGDAGGSSAWRAVLRQLAVDPVDLRGDPRPGLPESRPRTSPRPHPQAGARCCGALVSAVMPSSPCGTVSEAGGRTRPDAVTGPCVRALLGRGTAPHRDPGVVVRTAAPPAGYGAPPSRAPPAATGGASADAPPVSSC